MEYAQYGEWCDEPDREDFVYAELPCIISRNEALGNLCGYVGVPPSHPDHGKDWEAVQELQVHGGITWAAPCDEIRKEPEGYWWFGFDCAHAFDYCPPPAEWPANLVQMHIERSGLDLDHYRNWAYVRNEIQQLADQLVSRIEMPSYEEWLEKQKKEVETE